MTPQSFAQIVKQLLRDEFLTHEARENKRFEKLEGKVDSIENRVEDYRKEVIGFKAEVIYERTDRRLTRVEDNLHLPVLDF